MARLAQRLFRPIEALLRGEARSGVLLLATAIVALIWANSPWSASYQHLWYSPVTIGIGRFTSSQPLRFWINDGLMTIFFLVVGLEIRRELHDGELSQRTRAALPLAAAVGGMVVPALLYLALNGSAPTLRRGWGVPVATDIAFAAGVLGLLSGRVPRVLRILLLGLAIIDDIGAILIIALFYSTGLSLVGLAVAALGVLGILLLQWLGSQHALLYALPGSIIWLGMLRAGVHPTISGVIVGLLTPVRPRFGGDGSPADEALVPCVRIQSVLQPWVAYGIMPIFALANAGVEIGAVDTRTNGFATIMIGIVLGLVVGKPLGVTLATLAMVRLRLWTLPAGVSLLGVWVVGCTAGVGFTMAIFIAELAFPNESQLAIAKLAVLLSSAVAALLAFLTGRGIFRTDGAARRR
jgi:NhaA family Na+:H+ antiporter